MPDLSTFFCERGMEKLWTTVAPENKKNRPAAST